MLVIYHFNCLSIGYIVVVGEMSAIYRLLITTVDRRVPARLRPFWEDPAGPKTIFFWAPLMKWGLVLASMSDTVSRPVEKISVGQTMSLAATGLIWSRYSWVIIPRNYSLMAVNVLVAVTNLTQLWRIGSYRYKLK